MKSLSDSAVKTLCKYLPAILSAAAESSRDVRLLNAVRHVRLLLPKLNRINNDEKTTQVREP